jgi:methanogenic corrinoid protein MtbC1
MLKDTLPARDREGVVATILAAAEAGMPLEELYARVLTPFLEWLGARWQAGDAAVWEEHLLTSAARTAIDALYPRVLATKARTEPIPVTVAFFCPPEETHDLGLRMLVDRFDLRGFRTVYVGALTPFEQMVSCAREMRADVVCLSASTHFQRTVLRRGVDRLREDLPGVRIVVGGPAFARSCDGWGDLLAGSIDELLDELAQGARSHSVGDVEAAGDKARGDA